MLRVSLIFVSVRSALSVARGEGGVVEQAGLSAGVEAMNPSSNMLIPYQHQTCKRSSFWNVFLATFYVNARGRGGDLLRSNRSPLLSSGALSSIKFNLVQIIILELVEQGSMADLKQTCGLTSVPLGLLQRASDEDAF